MNENGQSNDSQEGIPKSAIERGITLEIMEHDDDNIIQTLSEGQALLSKGYRLHQNIGLDHSGMEFNSYLTDEERIRNRVSELLTTSLASSPTNSSEENHKATRKETKRREYKSKQTDQSLKRNPQKDQLQKKNSKKLKSGSSGAALPGITLSQEIINLPNQLYKQGLQQYVYLVSGHCYDRQTEGTTISSVDNFHIPLGHTQISTNNLLSRMNFCSSGGVTLVESEIDVIEEEREGREMEARMSESLQNEKTTQAVDKEDQIRKMEREKKLDGTLQLDTSKQDTKLKPVDMATFKQCINGLSSLKIVYLPSINIESSNVVTMATSPMSSTEDKDDKIESISDSSLSLSSQPCIMLKGQPSPPPQEESVPTSLLQPSCFTPYENKPVSSFEMENRVQQRYQEQAQKWVQQELMTHLIASLDNNDNPITTSPTASSSCNTTDTEDVTVTELVRNILLQETLTLLLQKEEKSEFKKEYDGEDEGHYDFSSFETDVSSTTPLSTPHPTPPQSPVPMEQAPPTEPVLITPVSSLSNILENITDKDDNISTPEPSSSILTDNTSPHPLISSCKDTTELDDTITTPIATPSHSAVVSTPDITSHKEPSIQLKKAPLESSTSDSTHSTSTTHLPVALSISESTTTDEELSLGQCLHDNKLQRLVKQRGDISSSEGEVPMSPGDVHWNILLQTKQDVVSKATVQVPMMTNFDLKDMSSDSSEKSWSQGHSLGEARIKQSKRVPNDGGGVFDKYLFKLTTSTPESDTSTTKHNNEDEDTDNTLAGIPSLTELDDDNKFHTIEHRSLSPGEVRRPLIKGSRRTENPLSDGEVPLELKMYRKSRNKRDIVVKDTTPRSISTENELRDGIDVINISRGKGVPQLSHTQIASPVINETIRVQVVHSISQDNQVTSSSSSPKLTISETPLQSPQQIKPHPYTITIAHAPPNDSSPGKTAQSLMQGPVKVIEESSQGTEPSCSSFSSISVPLPD